MLQDVARLGTRLIIQAAVEAEVTEFLGRARYQRAADTDDGRAGMRNGYYPTTVKTTTGHHQPLRTLVQMRQNRLQPRPLRSSRGHGG